MSFCFVLVLEPIWAVGAGVLFLGFVKSVDVSATDVRRCRTVLVSRISNEVQDDSEIVKGRLNLTYLKSSSVSYFLGFLGQHSQM